MLVDSHTHLGSFPSIESIARRLTTREAIAGWRTKHPDVYAAAQAQAPIDNSSALVQAMDRHGVDRSLVQATPGVTQDEVVRWARSHPTRLTALGCVTDWPWGDGTIVDRPGPAAQEAVAVRARHAIEELGVAGIGETRVSAITTCIDPIGIAADLGQLMEVLAERHTPIQILTGWTQFPGNLHYQDPLWVDELAGRYPDVPIVLTKMGRSVPRFFDSAMVVAMRNSNVHLDIVGTCVEHLRSAYESLGPDRILFGTDWSYTWRHVRAPADVHTRHLDLVGEAIPDHAGRELLLGGTAARLFALAEPEADREAVG